MSKNNYQHISNYTTTLTQNKSQYTYSHTHTLIKNNCK